MNGPPKESGAAANGAPALRYIAIEGPIGVGATKLARRLAQHWNAGVILEEVAENPFLGRFYADRRHFAFQTQVFFLLSRYRQLQQVQQTDLFQRLTISDYVIDRDRIFAWLNLEGEERTMYDRLYEMMYAKAPKPDLVVFLQARSDVLIERLRAREPAVERRIPADYIELVVRAYNDYFFYFDRCPLLVVNTSDIDLQRSNTDFSNLVRVIGEMRGGRQHYNPAGSASEP